MGSLNEFSPDTLIEKVLKILRHSPEIGDEAVFALLIEEGADRELAARIVEFLPMVYCRLLLSESGARFSETYRRAGADSAAEEKHLVSEPVWRAVMEFGQAELQRGSRAAICYEWRRAARSLMLQIDC